MRRYSLAAVRGDDDTTGRVLRDLHERVFEDTAPQIMPHVGHWWIAWLGDVAAGFAGMEPEPDGVTGYLTRSGVLPEHRGHKLQVRLIRAREAKARELALTRMVSDTTGNIPSANSLIRAGYRLYEPVKRWAYDDSLYWQKQL